MESQSELALVAAERPAFLSAHPGSVLVIADGTQLLSNLRLAQLAIVPQTREGIFELLVNAKLDAARTIQPNVA
jgi:hypothetical protein